MVLKTMKEHENRQETMIVAHYTCAQSNKKTKQPKTTVGDETHKLLIKILETNSW